MAEIVCPTTNHPKIICTAPNQLANSTDNTSYRLTNLTTPVSLLTVDAALKRPRLRSKCASEQWPFSKKHTYTGKNLNALITETPDAYVRLQVTHYAFVEILKSLLKDYQYKSFAARARAGIRLCTCARPWVLHTFVPYTPTLCVCAFTYTNVYSTSHQTTPLT